MARNYTLRGLAGSGGARSPARPPIVSRPILAADSAPEGAESLRLVNCGISERTQSISDFWQYVASTAPVSGFRVLKNDVVTVRTARYPDELAARLEGCKRGKIEWLSSESRRRLALLAGNCSVDFRSFVTLTYPASFPCDGELVKVHLHAILAALRRKCPGLEYLWFLEFQRRKAPHFHAFLDQALPEPLAEMNRNSGRVRKVVKVHWPWQHWLSRRWFEIVASGDPKHLRAGAAWEVVEKSDGAARYVAKECYKTFQKVVPEAYQNVGRFWGCSRGVKLVEERTVVCQTSAMRAIFDKQGFRDDGDPHAVLFGAADAYRNIMDTELDPVKVKAWKRTPKNQTGKLIADMPLPKGRSSAEHSARARLNRLA